MQCRLTERIEIKQYTKKQDKQGFTNEELCNYYKCWACFQAVSSKDFENAMASNTQDIVIFTVRYCEKSKNINKKEHKIQFKNKLYSIVGDPYDVNNQHNFIDIRCKCVN